MAFKISNIYKSIVRQIVLLCEATAVRGVSPNINYYGWDANDDEAEMPSNDLIGLAGWSFTENKGLWEIHCGITISTFNDTNLFREIQLVDAVHDIFGDKCTIPMLDDDGNEYAQLVVEEFEMLPAGNSEKRNFRPIGLTLRRTSSA